MEIQTIQDGLNISLPSSLDLPVASELRDALLNAMGTESIHTISLDVSNVERISTAVLQVLMAARAEFPEHDKVLRIIGQSPAFTLAVEQIGLDSDSLS